MPRNMTMKRQTNPLRLSAVLIGSWILGACFAAVPTLPCGWPSIKTASLEPVIFFENPAQQAGPSAAPIERPLFGMTTEPASGEVAAKWRAIENEIDREKNVLAGCRAKQTCPSEAQSLLDIVAEGAGRTDRARVGLINRAVDLAIRPTSDEAQWGISDHWSPPFETLRTRRGDCEDYAILKYAALLQAGMAPEDVKIVILKLLLPNEDHATVAARVEGQWLILDNRRLVLVRDSDVNGSIPRFVLDQNGARRFIPYSTRG
jgi:predicted transglutaminase-like cysteine proteinase